MNILLDTHTVLWFLLDDDKLSSKAKLAIMSEDNNKFVSLASAWELSIKMSLGKIYFEGGMSSFFKQIYENNFEILPITLEHIMRVEYLPIHHKDPFDRLIVAAALEDDLTILTVDSNIHLYESSYIW